MKTYTNTLKCMATALLLLLGAASIHSAENTGVTESTGAADIAAIAKEYYHALHTGDHDRVRELSTATMAFIDPTAEGQPNVVAQFSDREAFLAYMKAGSADLDAEAIVTKSFKTGRYVTLYVVYKGSIPGDMIGAPGKTVSFEIDGVTILTVEEGKVVHQRDYVDYESMNAQFAEQLGG